MAGQTAELAELAALLDQSAGQTAVALAIPVIGGAGGVGKTALAVHWAHQVAGLVARDGATRLVLDLLPLDDATGLLRALIGARSDADPEATALLAQQCSRLPLALRVAAELASARAGVPLACLVDELADEQQRLSLLNAGGDPRTAIRAVFSWSYRYLDTFTARAFRLARLHPGPDFGPHAVAALTNGSLEDIGTVLMRLRDLEQADSYLSQALALSHETSNRYHQAEALTRTGDVRLRQGRPREARARHALASPGQARDHCEQALARYTRLGAPEADQVRALLADTGTSEQ